MKTKKRIEGRKILLVAPLFVIPLLIWGFSLMGGGKTDPDVSGPKNAGINTSLPDADLKKDTPKDKLSFYEQAGKDTASKSKNIADMVNAFGFDPNLQEAKTSEITSRIEAINREISKPAEPPLTRQSNIQQDVSIRQDVDRLENLMKTMQNNKTEDQEIKQLNGLMQNIMDIQHPELVKQKLKEQRTVVPDSLFKAIPAIIAESKKVVQGATVKLILKDSIQINGMNIPKGHALFGQCQIVNQRLLLDITQIRLGTSIIPVDLSVYSLDGMIGIDAPDAVVAEALNSGADNAVRDMGFLGFDQTLGTRVATAGIDAAKNLISKQLRRVKVKLKSGYSILLRNNQVNTR